MIYSCFFRDLEDSMNVILLRCMCHCIYRKKTSCGLLMKGYGEHNVET